MQSELKVRFIHLYMAINLLIIMLNFTPFGLLIPDRNIVSSIDELESEFVKAIPSNKRNELFDRYKRYSQDLKIVCNGIEIRQWVNGSFTTKRTDPGDIDLISFINYELIEANESGFSQFRNPNSKNQYGVDAYILIEYPENHRNYTIFKSDKLYWLDHFDKTEPNRQGVRRPKGFLEIIY